MRTRSEASRLCPDRAHPMPGPFRSPRASAKIWHMPRLLRKSLASPDLVRSFPFGHVDIVNLDETSVARFSWEPGWRWSKDVAPVVQTRSCQSRHVGYVIAGQLH